MGGQSAEQARQALVALASLTPSRRDLTGPGTIPLDWFRWLPLSALKALSSLAAPQWREHPHPGGGLAELNLAGAPPPSISIERSFGEQLAAVDQIRPGQRSLRLGWLFVAGRIAQDGGRSRRIFWPLVTRTVLVSRSVIGPLALVPAGDVVVTRMIGDPAVRDELSRHIELGGGALDGPEVLAPAALLERLHRLKHFSVQAAGAADLPATELVAAGDSPDQFMRRDGLVVVAGVAVFAATETGGLSHAASLEAWSQHSMKVPTGFHALYTDTFADSPTTDRNEVSDAHDQTVESPFLLTPVQRSAIRRSRTEPVTVVRGAPGTGKSHTITAIACDALSRGDTVLVSAKSEATVDALVDLFERAPGPRPVIFGSNERKDALAEHLAGGLHASADEYLERARVELRSAIEQRDLLRRSMAERLQAEVLVDRPSVLADVRISFPELLEPGTDLDVVTELLDAVSMPASRWRERRRHRRAMATLNRVIGSGWVGRIPEVRSAVDLVAASRQSDVLESQGGVTIGSEWTALLQAEDSANRVCGEWLELESRSPDRLDRASLAAVSALGTALRSGRSARREQLARMDDRLTRALPLWAGTLVDIDDLLPAVPGLFDLVVLDEASSIDQPTAASALLRGKRAVIVGDPKQLRHVSFLSDEQRDRAIVDAGIEVSSALAARLDVRRNSTFDLAAGAAPVTTLDEHFRCRPHLVDFVARRLYDGQVKVATRTPATQSVDCVEIQRVDGIRDRHGVIGEEVEAVLGHLRRLVPQRRGSVGVISPFRAQADALEAAVLASFSLRDIEALDLRVGTVHAFQGNERDLVIASIGLDSDADRGAWRFVEDPHLFTVLVTRARRKFIVVHSADPPPVGLVAEYFAQADEPPRPPDSVQPDDLWTATVVEHLIDAPIPITTGYPSGRHRVDICIGDAQAFSGTECVVHRDGPEAHIDRHLDLVRRGWPLTDAFPSRWGERVGERSVELTALGTAPSES